ncbi:MAG: response regulator [Calditrichaeota bacterium]|nr:response regulator [Calditrichota bacterium]
MGWSSSLTRFDYKKNDFKSFHINKKDENSLGFSFISAITEDDDSHLWLATAEGLTKVVLDRERENIVELKRYYHHDNDTKSIGGNWVSDIKIDNNGNWIIGLYGHGINIFDRESEEFYRYENEIQKNVISLIFDDTYEIIWIGGTGEGLVKAYEPRKKIKVHQNEQNSNSLNNNSVTTIYEDSKGTLWISTFTGGLNKFDRSTQKFSHYTHDPGDPETILTNEVATVCEDSLNNLFVCTTSGLDYFETGEERFSRKYPLSMLQWMANDPINKDKILWLGSAGSGLYEYNLNTGKATPYLNSPNSPHSISDNYITYVFSEVKDSIPMIWVGTEYGGLNQINLSSKKIKYFQHQQNNPKSISNNAIKIIYRDNSGTLWIGTRVGLNKYLEKDNSFVRYHKQDGLPDEIIVSIQEDNDGNLWLGTTRGICRFDPKGETFLTLTTEDGLPSNEFVWTSSCKTHSGELIFGSYNGFCIFHPDSFRYNKIKPPVYLTDFQLFHKSVQPGENSPLKKSITFADEITLHHNQNIFSLEFSALNYIKPNKNIYMYKMEGIDPNWVYTDAFNRQATYTNLDPGEYVFKVKGSNNDGVWNEEGTSIKVIILPPWWQTSWAYTVYILLIGLTIAVTWRAQLRRLRMKHQLEIKHLQAEKLQEIDRAKSRFFANISHEFRTPLTLLLGPLEKMLSWTTDEKSRENLNVMQRSAYRLHRLIDQLLDLSKLEAGKMKLQAQELELSEFLKPLVYNFTSWAESKKIELKFIPPSDPVRVYVDPEMMEKVVNNLLSNALKFTPSGGRIEVSVFNPPVSPLPSGHRTGMHKGGNKGGSGKKIVIRVSDTGPGISPDKLNRIFDRFYQTDDSISRIHEGTGIGLALTKELVELHHGTIDVQSEVGQGSVFTIQLPLGKEHLKGEEIADQEIREKKIPGKQTVDVKAEETVSAVRSEERDRVSVDTARSGNSEQDEDKKLPGVLIVEDNTDMQKYIKDYLEEDYRIITALDGKEGFEKAIKGNMDLIISDVMMPVMDGFDFCKKLKSDQRTSHIPVILLTAKADMESKLEGLELGADDYISKPFEVKELQVRVKNLIMHRRKLKDKFDRDPESLPGVLAISSLDRQFLKKVVNCLQEHLDDPAFSAEEFSKSVGMSRSQFYRKLHALTGHSVSSFVRLYRLKQAARLLRKHSGNISQIAYEVGFNNLSYFSHCFQKQFGELPSQYVRNAMFKKEI